MARALLHRLTDQRGTTLVELLVAIPAALIVAAAILPLSGVFNDTEKANANRTTAIQAQQVALARLTREIRQAAAATVPATGQLQLTIPVANADGTNDSSTVTYDCTQADMTPGDAPGAKQCVRQADDGTTTIVLSNVSSVAFERSDPSDPGTYITVTALLNVASSDPTTEPLVVKDGAALQNASA